MFKSPLKGRLHAASLQVQSPARKVAEALADILQAPRCQPAGSTARTQGCRGSRRHLAGSTLPACRFNRLHARLPRLSPTSCRLHAASLKAQPPARKVAEALADILQAPRCQPAGSTARTQGCRGSRRHLAGSTLPACRFNRPHARLPRLSPTSCRLHAATLKAHRPRRRRRLLTSCSVPCSSSETYSKT